MEYTNSIYYTFSTIAQVLAGFIALSGVFVVIKLGELKKILLLIAKEYYFVSSDMFPTNKTPVNLKDIDIAIKTESSDRIISEMEAFNRLHEVFILRNSRFLIESTEKAIKVNTHKNKIKDLTLKSIYIGIGTILFSLITLACTTLIHEYLNQFEFYILLIGIVLTSITFRFMIKAIILSLNDIDLIVHSYSLEDYNGNNQKL